jgi:ATP-dependent Clp protease adaptor protein ClpS
MGTGTQHQSETETVTRSRVERPPLYRVLLHNDDYTPMDFVVAVLRDIFRRDDAEAVRIMLHVHKRGIGVAGVYPHQVAETKVHKVHETAKAAGHPLKCTMEEA